MTTREQMARAMCASMQIDPDMPTGDLESPHWVQMCHAVDAALDAQLTITDAVLTIGEGTYANRHYHSGGMREIAADIFKDMVRAIREDK